MRVRLKIEKDREVLYEHDYDVSDAESFGKACSHAWMQLRERRLDHSTSIGALFEEFDNRLLDALDGASLRLTKA